MQMVGHDWEPGEGRRISGHAEEGLVALRAMKYGQHSGELKAFAESADPAERLARLQALHDQGVLTYSEYAAQRQRIIDSL
jgi:hypothetical protein